MLDKLLLTAKKPAKPIVLGTFFVSALFSILVSAGSFSKGFMPVIANLIEMVINIALWACVPTLLLLKKEDLAKKIFTLIFFYWLLGSIYGYLGEVDWATKGAPDVAIACGVFAFFLVISLIAMVAVNVVALITKKDTMNKISFCIFAGSFLFFILVFCLRAAVGSKYSSYEWSDYFSLIMSELILPCGMFFASLYFFAPQEDKAVAVEPKDEPIEEVASTEEKADEKEENA